MDNHLFFAVLVGMDFHRLFGVSSSVDCMGMGDVSVVCRRVMMSSLMMFGSFPMMTSRVCKVF